ncbi:MAG: flagellar export chaperone FliS [Gammaproteobacteria bacterium]|nr:flagellar export chaperone FliS [Gammaproteobacteria bacterium]
MLQSHAQRAAANLYSKVGVQGRVESANNHRLILMLMQGVIDRVAAAKGAMQNKDISAKGQAISKALAIIDGLKGCLNMDLPPEQGGDISENLQGLYLYMEKRLFKANLENSTELLEEVSQLMTSLKSAWEEIG